MEPKLVPTSWTKPLQIAVIAFYAAVGMVWLAELPSMTFIGRGTAVVDVLVFVGLGVIVIVGVAKRSRRFFEVIWVLLLLDVALLLLAVVRGDSLTYGLALPAWASWGRIVQVAVGGALALTMLYARRERGPWGMTQQPRGHAGPDDAQERLQA